MKMHHNRFQLTLPKSSLLVSKMLFVYKGKGTPSRSVIVGSGVIANLRSGVVGADDNWGLADNIPLSACWSSVAIVLSGIASGVGMLETLTWVCDLISRYLSKYECERRQGWLKTM